MFTLRSAAVILAIIMAVDWPIMFGEHHVTSLKFAQEDYNNPLATDRFRQRQGTLISHSPSSGIVTA